MVDCGAAVQTNKGRTTKYQNNAIFPHAGAFCKSIRGGLSILPGSPAIIAALAGQAEGTVSRLLVLHQVWLWVVTAGMG